MSWHGVKELIGKAAPLVGAALAGPAGGSVGAMLANVFGVDAEPLAVTRAIQQDPDALVKVKQFELENEQHIRELAFKTLQIELADKANARSVHRDSRMPATLSVMLSVMIVIIVVMLFYVDVPAGAREVLFMLLGVVVKEWGGSMQYWFGTTRGSSDKSKALSQNFIGSFQPK